MIPITGRASSFIEFLKLQSQSKLKSNPIHFLLFFLPVSKANLSCVVATIFSSLAFLSSSVSMANLSRLVATSLAFLSWSIYMAKLSRFVAASFSSLALLSSSVSTANPRCLFVTTFSSLSFLSNSFSSPPLQSFEWPGAVSRDLLFLTTFSFPLVIFWLSFLLYLFCIVWLWIELGLGLGLGLASAFISSVLQSLKLCLL